MPELWGLAIHPMLTLKEERPFTDPEWIFEVKWDGTRALCFYEDGKFKLHNRRRDPLPSANDTARIAKKPPATYVAFDILYLDGKDLTGKPLMERKKILADV